MRGWLDRIAIASATLSDQRISRREALRATGQVTAAALGGAALTGAAAPDALASSNGYCLAACLVANDNGFDQFVGHCRQDYLASSGTGVDAAELIDCIAEAHRALKVGAAACATPFCGNRKRYPPKRRPPRPKPLPPTKPPLPHAGGGGSGPGGGRGGACGPDVFCDSDEICCTTNNGGQTLQFCLPKSQAGICHGAISGGT